MSSDLTSLSKKLSYALRHRPDAAGVTLGHAGWVDVEPIIRYLGCSREVLAQIVATDSKGRYQLSADNKQIRAVQGHSTQVQMDYVPAQPPAKLWHGTSSAAAQTILSQGLRPMTRQFVHLTDDLATAKQVALRRKGAIAIFEVDAQAAFNNMQIFYQADNGVWLTTAVHPAYLQLI